jgi:hypothetical protein
MPFENKVDRVVQNLTCDLTQEEWESRAKELSQAHRQTEATKERKKSVTAELNAELKVAEANETRLANIVATRTEQRDVTVEIEYNYANTTVTKRRTDTSETIGKREMTTDERQGTMFHDIKED